LKVLYCSGNNLTHLDLSKNENLKIAYCDHNHLSDLTGFMKNPGWNSDDLLVVSNNDLDYGDLSDILILKSRMGDAIYDREMSSGFRYSPQNGIDPLTVPVNINFTTGNYPAPQFRKSVEKYMGVRSNGVITPELVGRKVPVKSDIDVLQ
jgi:hypothetical protein